MTVSLDLHITGPDSNHVLSIDNQPFRIGRSPDNEVALIEDNTLSRQHCIVETRNGNVYVRDLDSRHGTWIRGKKLKIHRVAEGDVIFAGRSRLMFLAPGTKTPPMPKRNSRRGPPTPVQGGAQSPSGKEAGPGQSAPNRFGRLEGNQPRATSRQQRPKLEENENLPAANEEDIPRYAGEMPADASEPAPTARQARRPAPSQQQSPAEAQYVQAPQEAYAPPQNYVPAPAGYVPAPIEPVDDYDYENPPEPRLAAPTIVQGKALPALLGGKPPVPKGWLGRQAPADSRNQAQKLLMKARQLEASDVHVSPELPLTMRLNGVLKQMGEPFNMQDIETLIDNVCTEDQRHFFNSTGDFDYCYEFETGGRYRTNICRHRIGNAITFRLIKENVTSLADLGVPDIAGKLTEFSTGLVLCTGPMGSGKTTTMMSLAQLVNEARPDHLITVEDPIEFLMTPARCQVSQRQLGIHTQSFDAALKAALREDPDIIVIGDMRDYETTSLAISASETGHLVFASMHAMNCMKTLDKLIDMFPAAEQSVIRVMVSESLRGIVCQRLIPAIGGGRVPAVELLFNSVAIGNIIRENKVANLVNAMQLGRSQGMRTMDMALQTLLDDQKITAKTAFDNADNKDRFRARMLREEEEPGEQAGDSG
jgi:twitching motility protein PilT